MPRIRMKYEEQPRKTDKKLVDRLVDELKATMLFDVNIKGVFVSMKYEIEQMLKTGW